jgi:hypothetical protein
MWLYEIPDKIGGMLDSHSELVEAVTKIGLCTIVGMIYCCLVCAKHVL